MIFLNFKLIDKGYLMNDKQNKRNNYELYLMFA